MALRPDIAVLELAAQGHTIDRIARELHMSFDMTKRHLARWRVELGACNTTQAVAVAHMRGLLGTHPGPDPLPPPPPPKPRRTA